ncbi:MAG: hypothetical protein GF331_24475 [Chitinivibrionales bacterium]|nr:hypothetical protein [Chitinivibrionales bacterium]
MSRSTLRRTAAAVVLAFATLLALTGAGDRLLGQAGLGPSPVSSMRYLDDAFARSMKTFGVLSAVKVALAVVEGTEIGVGFGLQVGDAVQSTYDYIDVAWRTVLAGGVVLVGTRYLLESAALVGKWVLGAALAVALALTLLGFTGRQFQQPRRVLRDISLALTVIAVTLYVVLPLTVYGARTVSRRIIEPSLNEVHEELQTLRAELEEQDAVQAGLMQQLGGATERVRRIGSYLSSRSKEASVWAFRLVAGYLFDCIVFPLGLFVLLLWGTRGIARYAYGYRQSRTLREDLVGILDSYFSRRSGAHDSGGQLDTKGTGT